MITFRSASKKDVGAIAKLHSKSWQQNYRGALSDEFLDNEAPSERLNLWRSRLQNIDPDQYTVVAQYDSEIVGFVCFFLNHSHEYGALLDNLHVSSNMQGKGIGYRLMHLAAKEIGWRAPNSGMYLWVLEQNSKAIKFYKDLGGEKMETVQELDIGDRPVIKSKYCWRSLEKLIVEK